MQKDACYAQGEITKSQGNFIAVIPGVKYLRGTSDQVARFLHIH